MATRARSRSENPGQVLMRGGGRGGQQVGVGGPSSNPYFTPACCPKYLDHFFQRYIDGG